MEMMMVSKLKKSKSYGLRPEDAQYFHDELAHKADVDDSPMMETVIHYLQEHPELRKILIAKAKERKALGEIR